MNKPSNRSAADADLAAGADEDTQQREVLTVIVPCLNEEDNVATTAQTIFEVAPELPIDVEIHFIDDGSTDHTRAVMEQIRDEHPERCSIQINPTNMGLGRSVLKAYELLDGSRWATVLPGDNELIFRSIENFLEIRDRYDVILGYLKNPVIRPMTRRIASESFTHVANFLYGFNFEYFNGMKLYRVSAFKGIDVVSNGHAFNPELLAKAVLRNPDLRIGEAPFATKGRKHGHTKAFQPTSILEAVWDVYRGFRSVTSYRDDVIKSADQD